MKKVLNQQDVTDQLERFGMVVRDKDFFKNSEAKLEQFLINEEEDIFIWGVVTYVIHSVY